jgi:dTDP-4-amino-4,6-dideoxygalactose transaminase
LSVGIEGRESIHQPVKVFTVDSGRTALFTILKAAGIGQGDEVAIQAYTCVAVPEPILWVGARPVYIDCADDLTMSVDDLRKKITLNTKAVVIQHTFGQLAQVAELVAFAREKNLLVIEDCAHALGSEIFGQAVGTFGDAAFFSFGRDKSISSVFGGAIAVPANSPLASKISEIVDSYPQPSRIWVAQQLMHPLVLAIAKATYNFFSLGKILLEIAKRLGVISKAVQSIELSGGKPTFAFHQFSPALAVLAEQQLKKLDRFTVQRRAIAARYENALKNGADFVAPKIVPGHSYLRYTIFATSTDAVKNYVRKAKAAGIQLGDWYTTPIAPQGVHYEKIGYTSGSCPNAERLAQVTFNLPTHIGITRDMIEEIVTKVFK